MTSDNDSMIDDPVGTIVPTSKAITSLRDPEQVFDDILGIAGKSSGIGDFLELASSSEGKFSLMLTERGQSLHKTYEQASRLAEEKGMSDRDVHELLAGLESKWASHPGIVENSINDAIEATETGRAVEICERAIADWSATISKAGVMSSKDLLVTTGAGPLFIQLLANYEFALERDNRLTDALGVALLSRSLDPSDPENVLSSIVSLHIRTGDPMSALRMLEPLAESLAPYVLYGRALAYYALGQQENAQAAIQTALRHWPDVAQALTREWKGGTPMPKPGEAISELQVLFGYYEVFGAAWKSAEGAIEWLREAARTAQRVGGKRERYVGLSRSGFFAGAPETDEVVLKEQAELIRKAQLIGEDEFVRFLEVQPNTYSYDLTERGKALEEEHNALYRKDMKVNARVAAIEELLKQWPGHANAAIALARFRAQKEHFDQAVDILEPVIFDLQKFWPDDLVGNGRIPTDWPGNKPMLSAYAYISLDLAEAGDHATAKAYTKDYLLFNPTDNIGVRQKAIELAIEDGEFQEAFKLINEAPDGVAAYNLFGRALLGFVLKSHDAELALKNAVESRPLIWREMNADKHRMPHHYNPSWVKYYSPEEAFNYNERWAGVWLRKFGALAWLKKEGRKYLPAQ
jgi:tetratricopeptide (TPR) repeat protein